MLRGARVAQLREHEPRIGQRAAHHQFDGGGKTDSADDAGFRMQLNAVPHLVGQHACDFVRAAGFFDQPFGHHHFAARNRKSVQ